MTMRALSIRQPWAWAILHAGKDIENRPRRTHLRGRILIHASAGMTRDEYDDALSTISFAHPNPKSLLMPDLAGMLRGGIVGSVEIVDCFDATPGSPWFFGPFGYRLRNPRPLPFWPCKGQLGFFTRDWPLELLV